METDACTKDQRDAIIAAAERRRGYVLWLAGQLARTDWPVPLLIRTSAADELRQLVGGNAETINAR
jgi:hypothetical protein